MVRPRHSFMNRRGFLFLCGMMAENIDTIIFDFGGVLINIDYQLTASAFKELGMIDFDDRFSQAQQTTIFNDFETGKISSQRFINGLLDYLPAGTSPNQVVRAWNAMILDVPKASVDLLESLQGNYRIFLLSNTNEIHIPKALNEWKKVSEIDFYSQFENVFLSHEIGLRKPDEEIFHYVCEKATINRNTTLFIDDSIQHILGARKAGLTAYHLSSDMELSSLFS